MDDEQIVYSVYDMVGEVGDDLRDVIANGHDEVIIYNILTHIVEIEHLIEDNIPPKIKVTANDTNKLFDSILAEFDNLSSNFDEALKTQLKERIKECKRDLSKVYAFRPGPEAAAGGRNRKSRTSRKTSRKSRKTRKTRIGRKIRIGRKTRKSRKY
jgi:hypothetical protein